MLLVRLYKRVVCTTPSQHLIIPTLFSILVEPMICKHYCVKSSIYLSSLRYIFIGSFLFQKRSVVNVVSSHWTILVPPSELVEHMFHSNVNQRHLVTMHLFDIMFSSRGECIKALELQYGYNVKGMMNCGMTKYVHLTLHQGLYIQFFKCSHIPLWYLVPNNYHNI